jgi:hypothetical protein
MRKINADIHANAGKLIGRAGGAVIIDRMQMQTKEVAG